LNISRDCLRWSRGKDRQLLSTAFKSIKARRKLTRSIMGGAARRRYWTYYLDTIDLRRSSKCNLHSLSSLVNTFDLTCDRINLQNSMVALPTCVWRTIQHLQLNHTKCWYWIRRLRMRTVLTENDSCKLNRLIALPCLMPTIPPKYNFIVFLSAPWKIYQFQGPRFVNSFRVL